MSRKFVRNITGTKLNDTETMKEPFDTNVQNDLLSDKTDVYVRQTSSEEIEDQYHCLTDNIKVIKTNNPILTILNFKHGDPQSQKNMATVTVNKATKADAEKGTEYNKVMTPATTKNAIDHLVPPMIPWSDWNETDQNNKSYIKNKPEIVNYTNFLDYFSISGTVNKSLKTITIFIRAKVNRPEDYDKMYSIDVSLTSSFTSSGNAGSVTYSHLKNDEISEPLYTKEISGADYDRLIGMIDSYGSLQAILKFYKQEGVMKAPLFPIITVVPVITHPG